MATNYSIHKGAEKSHKGKPKEYIKPAMVGATDCTPGWRSARWIPEKKE